MKSKPILYIKAGCPWCHDALDFFADQRVEVEVKDVIREPEAMQRLREISNQSLTPTFEYDGFVVPDFSVSEFKEALSGRPEIRDELGIQV